MPNHADHLAAMQRRVIGDMLHLIHKPHGIRIAAEKFEWQFGGETRFIQF